jgi:putative tryptophan/tyrosine transport system substrate-binding protein
MMRRREVITLLGSAAAAWPLAAGAQQAGKLPTIGFLGAARPAAWANWVGAFTQRLRELGWIDGRNVVIEYRWAEGRTERYAEIAAEFVRLKVDVIVTAGGAVPAAKQATSVIPIVFGVASNPVEGGLVDSLARPGGNVTGLSAQQPDLVGKRLELLREIAPGLRRLAILANVGSLQAKLEMDEAEAAARALSLDAARLEVHRAGDIAPAFDKLGGASALYLCSDPLISAQRIRIITLAQGARLPSISGVEGYIESGGLMTYGANLADLFGRAANYVDKILRGAKPSDLPVEQPTKFHLAVNLITAKALGITVPATLLTRADEVIE